jgi:hypothetical protein
MTSQAPHSQVEKEPQLEVAPPHNLKGCTAQGPTQAMSYSRSYSSALLLKVLLKYCPTQALKSQKGRVSAQSLTTTLKPCPTQVLSYSRPYSSAVLLKILLNSKSYSSAGLSYYSSVVLKPSSHNMLTFSALARHKSQTVSSQGLTQALLKVSQPHRDSRPSLAIQRLTKLISYVTMPHYCKTVPQQQPLTTAAHSPSCVMYLFGMPLTSMASGKHLVIITALTKSSVLLAPSSNSSPNK